MNTSSEQESWMKAAHRLLKVEKEKYKLKYLEGDATGKLGSRQAIEQQGLTLNLTAVGRSAHTFFKGL